MDRQTWRDFFVTVFLLGAAFVLALVSSIAAEQQAIKFSAMAAAVSLMVAAAGAIYIVPRLAKRVQLEFIRFSVRTSVTVEGVVFVVFLVVIAFAAWNTGNNLLYLVLSALVAFLVAGNLVARISLTDVSVQLRFPDHIFAGEAAKLTVTITNHKKLMPSFSLLVEAVAPGSATVGGLDKLGHMVLVPASASARQRFEHSFKRRGCYRIEAFRISTRFPTGFFNKWRKVEAAGEIVIYPKPRPLDDFYHALPMLAGLVSSHLRGSGDELYAIRRYHPSDHMRHIDWKATAKSLALMVRDHVRDDDRRLTIVLDTTSHARTANREPGTDFTERFERGVVMAASLSNHFIQERAIVELITPSEQHNVQGGSGPEHLYRILRSLAALQPAGSVMVEAEQTATRKGFKNLLRLRAPRAPAKADASALNASGGPGLEHLMERVAVLADERRFKVLITSAAKGTIPTNVWRSAHVVFMEDL